MKKTMDPNAGEISRLALDLIRRQRTMTLATTDGRGAWAAPVYYLYHENAFFFFSDPQSRHIRETSGGNRAAAAIHADGQGWRKIKGVQMSGLVRQASTGMAGARAVAAYLQRFPFTQDLFDPGAATNLAAFTKRFKVKLYRFDPQLVFYQDNGIRFGFRVQTRLEDGNRKGPC
jgi:uncharacterized protein YhbP (UPF0306 family)